MSFKTFKIVKLLSHDSTDAKEELLNEAEIPFDMKLFYTLEKEESITFIFATEKQEEPDADLDLQEIQEMSKTFMDLAQNMNSYESSISNLVEEENE